MPFTELVLIRTFSSHFPKSHLPPRRVTEVPELSSSTNKKILNLYSNEIRTVNYVKHPLPPAYSTKLRKDILHQTSPSLLRSEKRMRIPLNRKSAIDEYCLRIQLDEPPL